MDIQDEIAKKQNLIGPYQIVVFSYIFQRRYLSQFGHENFELHVMVKIKTCMCQISIWYTIVNVRMDIQAKLQKWKINLARIKLLCFIYSSVMARSLDMWILNCRRRSIFCVELWAVCYSESVVLESSVKPSQGQLGSLGLVW